MSIPRSEHPNPQFMRESWVCLNGEWDFEIDQSVSGKARKLYAKDAPFSQKIIVPFCPESKLSGIEHKDFLHCVWYRRSFFLTKEQTEKRVVIHFGAVDYEAFVYVNEKPVGSHKGGYISFSFDITNYVVEGENIITVCAVDDVSDPMVPRGKQSEEYYSHGCDYTRTTGIWQTVWLEFTEKSYIDSVKYYPDSENGILTIEAKLVGKGIFLAEAYYEGRPVGKAEAQCNHGCAKVQIELSEKHLWEVGCGRLYDLKLSFCGDEVTSYFGLRNVCLDGYKFRINGKSVFQRLVLDQGFYPDGIYTAPTDEALLNDILISKAVGFNGARLHEKIFEPRFLYHCDREGYIVWGEYPNWGLDHSRPEAVFSILPEWIEELRRDFNHPSIIGWCPFNETWDVKGRKQCDEILSLVYHTTKAIDPTRPCIDTSGNYHVVTDIFDLHDYDQSPESYKKKFGSFGKDQPPHDNHAKRQTYRGEPLFISEYGGIRWSDDANSWGYGDTPKSEEEFIARYKGLTDVLLDNENIFGFCYTQLYDIEQEQNGLYTYDRKPKFDPAIFKATNERKAAIED